jgi:hypothetical protein
MEARHQPTRQVDSLIRRLDADPGEGDIAGHSILQIATRGVGDLCAICRLGVARGEQASR